MGEIILMCFWEDEISATTKLAVLSQNLCRRKSKQHRVTDASFRHDKLKNTQRNFDGMYKMSQ